MRVFCGYLFTFSLVKYFAKNVCDVTSRLLESRFRFELVTSSSLKLSKQDRTSLVCCWRRKFRTRSCTRGSGRLTRASTVKTENLMSGTGISRAYVCEGFPLFLFVALSRSAKEILQFPKLLVQVVIDRDRAARRCAENLGRSKI